MKLFISVVVFLFTVSLIVKAISLKDQEFEPQTPGMVVSDIAILTALIAWGSYLLNSQ